MTKPHRACDLEQDKLKFPGIVMPKIDGVRGVNLDGTIKQRTLKPIGNKYIEQLYSGPQFLGFDGELAVAGAETAWDLCRRSTSLVRSSTGGKDVEWHLFDFLHPDVIRHPYKDRLKALAHYAADNFGFFVERGIKIVPHLVVESLDDFLKAETGYMEAGYEGIIWRDPNGMHKEGYSSVKLGGYMRRKPRIDFEGIVVGYTEAMENQNEAKTNELGRSERSTHKENMVPKGMIGNIDLEVLKDVVYDGKKLLVKGQVVTVGPGEMPHKEREFFFQNPTLFLGTIGKAEFLAHGQKDKPRQAVWKTARDEGDL